MGKFPIKKKFWFTICRKGSNNSSWLINIYIYSIYVYINQSYIHIFSLFKEKKQRKGIAITNSGYLIHKVSGKNWSSSKFGIYASVTIGNYIYGTILYDLLKPF